MKITNQKGVQVSAAFKGLNFLLTTLLGAIETFKLFRSALQLALCSVINFKFTYFFIAEIFKFRRYNKLVFFLNFNVFD